MGGGYVAVILIAGHFSARCLSAPDGEILDAAAAHQFRVVEVAPVEDHRVLQGLLDGREVRAAEFLPLGDDDQRIGVGEGTHRALGVFQARVVAEDALRLVHGDRVVGGDGGAGSEEVGDQLTARRFAHVVGIGLEGEAPEREVPALEVVETALDLAAQDVFLGVVGFLDGGQHLEGDVGVVLGGLDQRLDVLGEAGAAVAAAGVEEVVADARVGADALADHLDVGTEHFGEVGEFVHEADARRQHGVGGILGEFGTLDVGDDQAFVVALEGGVEGAHQVDGLVVLGADDDAVGAHEVVDGGAFLEEFGVGNDAVGDVDRTLREFVGDGSLDLGCGADGDRALVDDDLVVGHPAADAARGGKHVLEVGGAVFVGRGADGDELDGAVLHGFLDIGGEVQAAGGNVAADHVLQAGFEDRDAACFEDADLLGIDIETEDIIAHLGQTGAADQTDVTGADDGDFHVDFSLLSCGVVAFIKPTTLLAFPVQVSCRRSMVSREATDSR